jgi:very-short-patch-repair endonuclease/predicted transcriptional regulator of viral defense system
MGADPLVSALAGRQHGLASRTQLLELGLSRHQIDRRSASGRLERVGHGVYRIGGTPPSWEQRVLVACLEGPALASHRTAGPLWALERFPEHRVEVSVHRGRRYTRDGVVVHESLDLDRIEPAVRRGIPTTPLDRTILDLGAVMRFEDYDLMVQRVVAAGRITWQQLLDVLVRHARRGRNGAGRLRAVLDERYGIVPAGSDFEVLVERLLVDHGLPKPVRQHEVRSAKGWFIARVDLAYPEAKIAIELDGRAFHTDSEAFEHDRRRQNELVLRGWTVLRFTWRQLLDEPGRIVQTVLDARQHR